MKKIISLFVIFALICGLTSAAFAEDGDGDVATRTLYTLGLFRGTGNNSDGTPNFDLERAPSRNEAITMLVRLLGKEEEAQSGIWQTPFTDVADWAKPYVGYAYANNLTNGTGPSTFGGNSIVSATQYLTFVLRALGYSSNSDFKWNAAWELSDLIGITSGEYNTYNNENFLRRNVVEISAKALLATLKNSTETMANKLLREGVFTRGEYLEAFGYELPNRSALSLALESSNFPFSGKTQQDANPENRMAHNIYSDPDLSETSGKFSEFSIDFLTENFAEDTYWALCNFSMDTSCLKEKYKVTDDGGAYAGLQYTSDGTKAIMSFWEIHYINETGKDNVLNAHRVFPEGNDNRFNGEGEGTNYIGSYEWTENHWYRMHLRCYDDEYGTTFVEQWILDIENGKWTLISRFNTGLTHSCFIGNMSQFMENYDGRSCNKLRSFRYKNLFVRDYESAKWKAINKVTLSADIWWDNKKGEYAFGADDSTLWGIVDGYGIDILKTNNHGPISQDFILMSGYYTPIEPSINNN